MRMSRCLGLALALGLTAPAYLCAEEKPPTEPPVWSPPLESGDLPSLVVRGTTRAVPNLRGIVELSFDQVLLGSGSGASVTFNCSEPITAERQLVALIPGRGSPGR